MVLSKQELIAFFEVNIPEDGYAEIEGSVTPKNDFSIRGGITKQVLIPNYTEEIEVKVMFSRKLDTSFQREKRKIGPGCQR